MEAEGSHSSSHPGRLTLEKNPRLSGLLGRSGRCGEERDSVVSGTESRPSSNPYSNRNTEVSLLLNQSK